MLIILVVLCSGLCGTPAESIILEPVSKLSKQTWSAKPSVPQPKSTLEQALPDTWPDPYRGGARSRAPCLSRSSPQPLGSSCERMTQLSRDRWGASW
jgi:hypothetical protein